MASQLLREHPPDHMGDVWVGLEAVGEAVEWAGRLPFEALARIYPGEYGAEGETEIRQLVEL